MKFSLVSPDPKPVSASTKKVYTSYLNKLASKGYTTVDDLVKHQKAIVEFINSHESKTVRTHMYFAVFFQLHNRPTSDKVAYINGAQMLKDEQYRKFIPETPVKESNEPPKNEVVKTEEKPAEKKKRVIKLKKTPAPAPPKPEGPPKPETVQPQKNLMSDFEKVKVKRILQDILASLDNLAKALNL